MDPRRRNETFQEKKGLVLWSVSSGRSEPLRPVLPLKGGFSWPPLLFIRLQKVSLASRWSCRLIQVLLDAFCSLREEASSYLEKLSWPLTPFYPPGLQQILQMSSQQREHHTQTPHFISHLWPLLILTHDFRCVLCEFCDLWLFKWDHGTEHWSSV